MAMAQSAASTRKVHRNYRCRGCRTVYCEIFSRGRLQRRHWSWKQAASWAACGVMRMTMACRPPTRPYINTSRSVTCFHDLEFAPEVQTFPDHWDMHRYLIRYAEHFGVADKVRFNARVTNVSPVTDPTDGRRWAIEFQTGNTEFFDTVVVATGHLSVPITCPCFGTALPVNTYTHTTIGSPHRSSANESASWVLAIAHWISRAMFAQRQSAACWSHAQAL